MATCPFLFWENCTIRYYKYIIFFEDIMIKLIAPTLEYKESFVEAIIMAREDNRQWFWNIAGKQLEPEDVEQYIQDAYYHTRWERLPDWRLANTTFWLVDEDKLEMLGMINIRHTLGTEFLEKYGWHIGYAVHPKHRQKGYGTMMLQLCLEKIPTLWLDLDKLLITCDETNIASQKIIEKNGGVFESEIVDAEHDIKKLRYWIYL